MLLFALGLGSSQSRFPALRWLNSRMVCFIGLMVSMSPDESSKKRDVMWCFAAVGIDVETSVHLYSALIGA